MTGQILMIGIVIIAFSAIALTVFSDRGAEKPSHVPHVDLQESINTSNNTIQIFHIGGDAIDLDEIKVILFVNGTRNEFSESDFKDPDGTRPPDDNVFTVGDCIVIKDDKIQSGIDIEMFFVHTPSKQVIQNTVLQTTVNQLPVANAGADQVVKLTNLSGTPVTLDGSNSTDDDLISPLTYNWTWNGRSATGKTPTIYLPQGMTTVILRVYDGQFSATDIVNITVNQSPVANAGADQVVKLTSLSGTPITLDGSDSTDDGLISPLTYNWTWNGGSATGVKPTIYLPQGITTVNLSVYDGQLWSNDTVNITVNQPPVANAGADQVIELTNLSSTPVTLDGSNSTDDGLISPLTYNWAWNGGSAIGVKPVVTLPKGITTINLTVYDGQFSANATVNITVKDIGFEIIGDSVVPNETFISNFTVLGAQISYGGSYDMMVTAQFKVGNTIFDPWNYTKPVTGNLNNNKQRSWKLPTACPANTSVTICGKSWQHSSSGNYNLDSSWKEYMTAYSTGDSANLIVLRNGSAVPNKPGYMGQASIATFVAPYVKDKKIVLKENEAIFLFELGTTDTSSSAADFQDLVVLMSIEPPPKS